MADDYGTLRIERRDQVAVVHMFNLTDAIKRGATLNFHWEIGLALSQLRDAQDVRVVILTGAVDGEFMVAPRTDTYEEPAAIGGHNHPKGSWKVFNGIIRAHQALTEMEKPVVARVNGDAAGFGQSLMFGCDLIVAREDARIADLHMGMGDVAPYGPPFALVPGDGGASLIPLYMTPPLAKEYLMLAKEYSGRELADMGMINYAVPLEELDTEVDRLVGKLLEKPALALAWTKRAVNRRIAAQHNLTLDAAAAYEMVNFLQWERQGYTQDLDFE
jgi:enoyl-CoA hydratase/carnithine racemase